MVNPTYMYMPKIPAFDESKDSIDSYIERFERFAVSSKWDKTIWRVSLSSLLTGRALRIYSGLPQESCDDYDILKEALLKGFECNAEGFRQKFKTSLPFHKETALQFGTRLSTYLSLWFDLSEAPRTYEGIVEFFLCDQLCSMLGKDLQIFVKERLEQRTLTEIAGIVDRHIEAHTCDL